MCLVEGQRSNSTFLVPRSYIMMHALGGVMPPYCDHSEE